MKFDLKYFILKNNALLIYREAIKYTYRIQDIQTRKDTQSFIRNEYEISRKEENRKRIEYMLGNARKQLNEFKQTYSLIK